MKEKLQEIFIKSKCISMAISGLNDIDFDNVKIDESGDIIVEFSYPYGGETEYKLVWLTAEDI